MFSFEGVHHGWGGEKKKVAEGIRRPIMFMIQNETLLKVKRVREKKSNMLADPRAQDPAGEKRG